MQRGLAEAKRATRAGFGAAASVALVVLLSGASLSCTGDGAEGSSGSADSSASAPSSDSSTTSDSSSTLSDPNSRTFT